MNSDLINLVLGPYDATLPGQMKLHLSLDGEKVVSAAIERGFLHRGIEKALEDHNATVGTTYAGRVDPENAAFGELVYCLAVEQLIGKEVPVRAQKIRMLVSEMTRVASHLSVIGKSALTVGSQTGFHYVFRDREKILDLFELLCGARFSLNFIRIGGVLSDVSDGFLERVLDFSEVMRMRIKEYNDILTYNYGFLNRMANVGVLNKIQAKEFGITGPVLRASGQDHDLRRACPYLLYSEYEFQTITGRGEAGSLGDCHDRYLVRLREVVESLSLIRQIIETMSPGPYINEPFDFERTIPSGEAYARVESPRGVLGCYVVSSGKKRLERIQFRTPSANLLAAVPSLLKGVFLEDLPVILDSLDINVSEADR